MITTIKWDGLSRTARSSRTLVPPLMQAWIDWAAGHLSGPPVRRREEAAAALASLDGLLLLRQLAGADVAHRAARRLVAYASPSRRKA